MDSFSSPLEKRYYLLDTLLHGDLPPEFHSVLLDSSTELFSEHQQERIQRGLEETMTIKLMSKSTFIVQTDEKQYLVNMTEPMCECKDFNLNCDFVHGEVCKHIWRIRALQKLEILPPSNTDPQKWILQQIHTDLMTIKNTLVETEIIEPLYNLWKDINSTPWYDQDWNNRYITWYKILELTQK